jgi:hypothetical protein
MSRVAFDLISEIKPPAPQADQRMERRKALLGEQQQELTIESIRQELETAKSAVQKQAAVSKILSGPEPPEQKYQALLPIDATVAEQFRARLNADAQQQAPDIQQTPEFASTLQTQQAAIPETIGSDILGQTPAPETIGERVVALPSKPRQHLGISGQVTPIATRSAREVLEEKFNEMRRQKGVESENRLTEKLAEQSTASANRKAELELAAALRPEPPVNNDTVVTAEGVKQWNPETRRFDIRVGSRPPTAAQVNAGLGGDDDGTDLQAYVNSLARGEIQPQNVPIKIRDKVLRLAQDQSVAIMSDREREAIGSLDTANQILKDVKKYSEKIHTGEGLGARVTGLVRQGASAAGYDADVTSLQSKAGELALIVRALGERGALAEGDVARALLLLPVNPRLTKAEAQNQLRDLEGIFSKVRSSRFETTTMPMRTNAPSTAPSTAPVAPAARSGNRVRFDAQGNIVR